MAERSKCEICNRDFPSHDALAMHNGAKHQNTNTNIKQSGNKMFIYFIIILFVAIGIVYFVVSAQNTTGNVINNAGNSNGDVQKINIGFKNYNYYPNTITVKQGIPVEITLDSSVRGCYRNFNIKSLGVSKSSSSPSDIIKFTPNQKGTFEFACGMRMGTGTIIVE